ncbi:hypothetical protein K1T71_009103 [Dendrolimus kikuchii]|uniref:Uncharacterized protein n=1 Tax=Dendrolimus kikuchii TaxID=765133 RepID=A0ACC1CTM4_9NEOP|nr:hypothetical protein K1T71_009103 [Dendrolimus kikuchii]
MSIQWTLIAGFLYFEIAVVTIMMLPIFSPRRWHQFFKSRLFAMFKQHAEWYFYALLGVMCLLLIDAIREMRKYSHTPDSSYVHLDTEMKGNIKLFRAQRNFYITGFAIFLSFVIRRLVSMLIIQDELGIKAEQIIKKAEDAVSHAKTTVLANTIQTEQVKRLDEFKTLLEERENELKEEKKKIRELEEEARKWRLKYEEIVSIGKGDE